MAAATFLNSTVNTVRRTRRAYIGAHVLAFEFAQKRAALRLKQLKFFGADLVAKGENIEKDAGDMFDVAKEKVADMMPRKGDAHVTLDIKPTRVVKPSKSVDLSTDITPKAEKTVKKAAPKTAQKTVQAKTGEAAQAGTILKDKYKSYIEGVVKYDADVNPVTVKKIVDHLGVALASRDGKFVACSDPAERETVAKSWLLKKLGVAADMDALDAKVGEVCETMKADRMKPRVTFYYLLAKNEGKLGAL